MGRLQRWPQRGQALSELALLTPIILGLFGLTLQGGLLISDQVNLQHYAYEGAQWAVANRTTATAAAIRNHIQAQMCGTDGSGNPKSIGASDALTRFCHSGSLTIAAPTVSSATALDRGGMFRLAPVDDALAASGCKDWDLSVPSSVTVRQGQSADISVSLTTPTGSGSAPVVTLGASHLPQFLSNGAPQFNPPTISGAASSTLTISPSGNTDVKHYTVHISGIDQCGGTSNTGTSLGPGKDVDVNVTDGGGVGTVTIPINLHVDGVFPVCIPVSTPATINVVGVNLAAGATVTIGAGATAVSATATSSSSTQIAVTIPSPPPVGVYDVTVTNPDGNSTTIANVLTVASSCPSPLSGQSGSTTTCFIGGGSGAKEYLISITWNEQLVIPWISSNLGLTATQRAFCQ
jgi:hypothetical protein